MDTGIDRIQLLKVPIDIVPPGEFPNVIHRLLLSPRLSLSPDNLRDGAENTDSRENSGTTRQSKSGDIVLLSLWDLLRARRNGEYRDYILNAALVIPISKSLVSGAKFLTGKQPFRYMPFNFVISLLTLLEKREYPLYLLGCESSVLKKAEKNIRATFPRLKIIGRCEGRIGKQNEPAVMEAIRKASPSLLLAGKGIRGGELWIARNSKRLNSGLRLWCSDLFEVFAEEKRRPSDAVFEKGLEAAAYCFRNPLKFFRLIPYFRYKILLLLYKILNW